MSGTSADGIDAALVYVDEALCPPIRVVDAMFRPFSEDERAQIFQAFDPACPGIIWAKLHRELGEWYASCVIELLRQARVSPCNVRVIGCHGQTMAHYPPLPDSEEFQGFTVQLGDPAVIAARTGIDVVHHFRQQDMAWGGQGAPLVPYFDYRIWASRVEPRVVLNIGGIANVTILPKGAGIDEVTAFDTGPGNMVLDALVEIGTQGRQHYDSEGSLAAQGRCSERLLKRWLSHPYFHLHGPKSTGRERFGRQYANQLWKDGLALGLTFEDILRTATALVAESISRAVQHAIAEPCVLIVSGGGVHNRTLMRELERRLSLLRPLETTDKYGIGGDMKEAVAFAFLAWQFCEGIPTSMPQITGAEERVVLGCWTPARPGRTIDCC